MCCWSGFYLLEQFGGRWGLGASRVSAVFMKWCTGGPTQWPPELVWKVLLGKRRFSFSKYLQIFPNPRLTFDNRCHFSCDSTAVKPCSRPLLPPIGQNPAATRNSAPHHIRLPVQTLLIKLWKRPWLTCATQAVDTTCPSYSVSSREPTLAAQQSGE